MKSKFILLILFSALVFSSCNKKPIRQRVIITTDIQLCCDNPDDVQSLCHVLWYADQLDIKAIIPEKFERGNELAGITAAERVIENYRLDYNDTMNNFVKMGFPSPDYFLNEALQTKREAAIDKIISEAILDEKTPLYILVWGNMNIVKDALLKAPEITDKIRILSIGTNLRVPSDGGDGAIPNWNGAGRNRIFWDPAYDEIWWIENDWGYKGMFEGLIYQEEGSIPSGGRPYEMMNELASKAGNLGKHMKEALSSNKLKWAYFFRAGDTPSVLYLIDPDNDLDNPAFGSWAGIFQQPFTESHPNYWTNISGESKFDYNDPVNTWRYADTAIKASFQHLLDEREEMYGQLLSKVEKIYGKK